MKAGKVVHLTTRHCRDDIRVFHKMAVSTAKMYSSFLVVFDGKGNDIVDNVNIVDLGLLTGNLLVKLFKAIYRTYRYVKKCDASIYQIHDPELILVAALLKAKGQFIIYDMHEHNSKQLKLKRFLGPMFVREIFSSCYYFFESIALKLFDYVFVPQDSMQKEFSVFSKNVLLVSNYPDCKISEASDCYPGVGYGSTKIKNIIYSGAISEDRGIFNILNLVCSLDSNYRLTLCGNVDDNTLAKLKTHEGWSRVNYLGRISQSELYDVYDRNSIGLILFNNVGQYYMANALKLFEYMRHGMVIIMPDFGDWLEFNSTHKVGFNVDVKDAKSTARLIENLSSSDFLDYYERNRDMAMNKFNWRSQEEIVLSCYSKLIYQ